MTARLRHLKPEHYRVQPWKNGGGTTTEIAVDPLGVGVGEPFLWRLSLAKVEGSGPFSAFPGYDRTIMLVSGDGMVLSFAGHGTATLSRPFQPVFFDGGWATSSRLIGGASEDFNVITDQARLRHRVVVTEPRQQTEVAAVSIVAVMCFLGAIEVRGLGRENLKPRECLIAEQAGPLTVGGPGVAAIVEMTLGSLNATESPC
jgi:environmental stress-induced protein Ves